MENPEIQPQNNSHAIFDKVAKNIQWRRKQSLQQVMLGKLAM
jgi:hypothetical protein